MGCLVRDEAASRCVGGCSRAIRGKIVVACSFGAEDVVLVDMVHRINPSVPLFYLDTDFLFPETYATRDRVIERYGLIPAQVIQVKSLLTPQIQSGIVRRCAVGSRSGPVLPAAESRTTDPRSRGYDAWITGIRRDQAPSRANARLIEWDQKFELIKINPLARWTWTDVWTYIKVYEVPYNPLHDQNYPSIGCTYCTTQVAPGDDPRAGRWKNFAKTECGLHKS